MVLAVVVTLSLTLPLTLSLSVSLSLARKLTLTLGHVCGSYLPRSADADPLNHELGSKRPYENIVGEREKHDEVIGHGKRALHQAVALLNVSG